MRQFQEDKDAYREKSGIKRKRYEITKDKKRIEEKKRQIREKKEIRSRGIKNEKSTTIKNQEAPDPDPSPVVKNALKMSESKESGNDRANLNSHSRNSDSIKAWKQILNCKHKSAYHKPKMSRKPHSGVRIESQKGQGQLLLKNKWGFITLNKPAKADKQRNNKQGNDVGQLGESGDNLGPDPVGRTEGVRSTSNLKIAELEGYTGSEEESNF